MHLSPKLLQVSGLILLFGSAGFWAVTGRESLQLMSAAMALIGLGSFRGAVISLREQSDGSSKEKKE